MIKVSQKKDQHILVVDDNLRNIQLIGTILREEGFPFSYAQSGKQALEIADTNPPNLILLDIMMPGMDGFETCEILKSNPKTNDIPVIFLSALSDTSKKVEGFNLGAVDYVTKPVQREELLARVEAHLEIQIYRKHLEKEIQIRTENLMREVEERKKIEEQLVQAQKMETVGTLAGGLAHDFNNILGGIVSPLSLLKRKLKKGDIAKDQLEKYIDIMTESSNRAVDMIKQLLTLSRKQELNLTAVDLISSIKNVIKICDSTFDKSIKIVTNYPDEPAVIKADKTQVEQVLLNFCVNASHAMTIMHEDTKLWGGTLEISIQKFFADRYFCKRHTDAKEINYWHTSVKDTGIGMSTSVISKIFTPFFTTKEKGTGTGLGLSMVYNIIKEHGGFIDVYSEPGVGSTFDIYIPLLTSEGLQEKIEQKIISKGEGLILVVDDEKSLRLTAKDILEDCGYEVVLASDGKDGLEVFSKIHSNLKGVILDMSMPEMSGKETFIKMKEIKPDVRVLFASGFKEDKRVKEVLELGACDFIQKPYTIEKLSEAIHGILIDDSVDK